jgi:Pretoxin HINT domain
VWAHDPETGKTALKPIVRTYVNDKDVVWKLSVEKEGNYYLHEVTASHPYYVIDKGWVTVGELQVGQIIKTKEGGSAQVKNLLNTGEIVTTYNFEVKDINTYYVSAAMVLVHNCGGNRRTQGPKGEHLSYPPRR